MSRRASVFRVLVAATWASFVLCGCGEDAPPGPDPLVSDVLAALKSPPAVNARQLQPAELGAQHSANLVAKLDEALARRPNAPADLAQEVRAIRDLYAQAAELYQAVARRGLARSGSDPAWLRANDLMLEAQARIEALPGAPAPPPEG